MQTVLKNAVVAAGIELHENWKMSDIRETDDGLGVVAVADDGREITGSWLAASDGLRGIAREILLKKMGAVVSPPEYTGLLLVSQFRF